MRIEHALPCLGESGGGPPRSVSQLCNALCRQEQSIGIDTAVYRNDPMVKIDSKISLTTLKDRRHSSIEDSEYRNNLIVGGFKNVERYRLKSVAAQY